MPAYFKQTKSKNSWKIKENMRAHLPAHKSLEAKALIEEVGANLIRLPPYRPDLNPIEMSFQS
ncbi:MAG: transposase [Thermoguttaceae bacterium]